MTEELFDEICDALKDRERWERKQTLYYDMRHKGVPRKQPYPNASDVHGKIGDTFIDKLKPFYVQLLYTSETFASFISKKAQDDDQTAGAAYWMDYKLKQCSNVESEMMILIDLMCQAGQTCLKTIWNDATKQIQFDATDPLHIIVPNNTQDIQCADWLVHILHYSKDQYKRKVAKNGWKGDEDFVKSIAGKGTHDGGSANKDRSEKMREGITCGANENQIIVWEYYSKLPGSTEWVVQRFSPMECETPISDTFKLDYSHGQLPFVQFTTEVIGKSFLSPRGLIERVASEEQAFNKYWNKLNDWMDFSNNFTFSVKEGMSNSGSVSNIRMAPGDVLPDWVTANQMPVPPVDFQEQMSFARSMAEDKIQLPDLSNSQHMAGAGESTNQTATKVRAVMALSSQGNDIRARVFRAAWGKVLKMCWSLYLQYDKDDLDYVLDGEAQKLDQGALHDRYLIEPNGSPDSWNREAQVQKSALMFQTLQGNPYVPQDELTKDYIENFDPRKVKKLFRDPGIAAQTQQERQALELMLMDMQDYLPDVNPDDDDKTHILTIAQDLMQKLQLGKQITPMQAQFRLKHGAKHAQALAEKKDPAAKQLERQVMPIIQHLEQISGQQTQPVGQNGSQPQQMGLTGNGNGSTPPVDGQVDTPVDTINALTNLSKSGAPLGLAQLNAALVKAGLPPVIQPAGGKSSTDPQKDAATVMNALAALKKAGAPVTIDQVNPILIQAGIPPLRPTAPMQQPVLPKARP